MANTVHMYVVYQLKRPFPSISQSLMQSGVIMIFIFFFANSNKNAKECVLTALNINLLFLCVKKMNYCGIL